MPQTRICPQCGAPLPSEGWEGLCPKCLVRVSLESLETSALSGLRNSDAPGAPEAPHSASGHPLPSEGRGQGEGQVTSHQSPVTDPHALPEKTVALTESDIVLERTGMMIGRYKLLQQIGEGGFGVVFMAEQMEPVQRKVALKVIKAGMDTREVNARFEAERQALALMDHPNIAQVLDGGATASGRPYFVMELVRGLPITNYCDQANLSTRERLELFIKVCRAVQHAHQKGVIHRDLKPNNILITLHDGEPVPKVIDFGVAKALGQKLTDKTLFTRFEQMIGTPAYMSPEQAALGGLDIDTRSDIYSLGVLLYELLTGVTPLDAETLRKGALDEIRRMIRETDPPKPSTRITDLVAADVRRLSTVATEKDRTSLRRLLQQKKELISLIRGDLDWITMKALEKDRRRRYETVNSLAADIERHLKDEPVVARPPSALYRLQKVARRHRVAFAAGAVVTVALLSGVVISTWQAVRATRAERGQSRLREQAEEAQANEATQRRRAEDNAAKSRARLVRQYVASGNRLVDEGDLLGALPWFAKALKEEPDPARADIHRLRLGTTLQQCPKLAQVWFHNDVLRDAKFSPDGRWVLTTSDDATARVWDATTGEAVSPLLQGTAPLQFAAFSPDSQRVAAAIYGANAGVWDIRTGQLPFPFLPHGSGVHHIEFSPDGRLLVTGSANLTAQFWDAATGAKVGQPMKHETGVEWVSFSRDGTRVVTVTAMVAIWRVPSGEQVTRLLMAENRSADYGQFSPDGQRVAIACRDGTAWVFEAATGKVITLVRHQGSVHRACFSPDGRWLLTASGDGTAGVWNAATGEPISATIRHAGPVADASFSPDARLVVTASADGTAGLWHTATGKPATAKLKHGAAVVCASFSPDGQRVVTASDDHTARLWDLRGAGQTFLTMKHPAVVQRASFSPDSRWFVTVSVDGTAHVCGLGREEPLTNIESILVAVRHAQFSPNSRLLAAA